MRLRKASAIIVVKENAFCSLLLEQLSQWRNSYAESIKPFDNT
jgi:hypothetical protein